MNFAFNYRLKTDEVPVRHERLWIDCLANLDETIDALFDHLKATGEEALLEDLCPYFGVVWPSALALADLMALEPRPGAELLEIGCGLALPSLMAARGGSRVLATDSHPEVPRFLERNLARNLGADARANLAYVSLDWQAHWHQADAPSPLGPRRFDRVIGSDILYERKYPPMVARVIDEHLREGGEAIVTDPGRPYLQDLADEMKKRGFACDTQIRPVANPAVGGVREIFVLRFRRGGATNGPGAARADGNTT